MIGTALLLAALSAAAAAPAAPAAAEQALVPTKWSLEKAAPKNKAARRKAQAVSRRQAVQQAKAKPRVIAGATASNRGNRNKPQAKVGVALPF